MIVIIPESNIPETCKKCPFMDWHLNCKLQEKQHETWEEMKENCPLKSIDGLIEKMQSEIARLRDYNTKLNQQSGYYSTPEIQNVSGNIKGLLDAVAIIKEYCGMED